MLFNVCFVLILGRFNILNAEEIASLCTLLLVTVGYINLITLCIPLNGLRTAVLILSGILIVIGATALSSLFGITKVTLPVIICFVSQVAVSLPISFLLKKLESKFKNPKFIEKMLKRK